MKAVGGGHTKSWKCKIFTTYVKAKLNTKYGSLRLGGREAYDRSSA